MTIVLKYKSSNPSSNGLPPCLSVADSDGASGSSRDPTDKKMGRHLQPLNTITYTVRTTRRRRRRWASERASPSGPLEDTATPQLDRKMRKFRRGGADRAWPADMDCPGDDEDEGAEERDAHGEELVCI